MTRDGSQLKIGKKPFRFAGTNLYWLGLDENVGGIDYPTYFRIRDALDTAKATGMTVVRSHMMASTGHPKTLLPSASDGYNDEAFRRTGQPPVMNRQVSAVLHVHHEHRVVAPSPSRAPAAGFQGGP